MTNFIDSYLAKRHPNSPTGTESAFPPLGGHSPRAGSVLSRLIERRDALSERIYNLLVALQILPISETSEEIVEEIMECRDKAAAVNVEIRMHILNELYYAQ